MTMDVELQLNCEQQDNYYNPSSHDTTPYPADGDSYDGSNAEDEDENDEDEDLLELRAKGVKDAMENLLSRLGEQTPALSPPELDAKSPAEINEEDKKALIKKRDAERDRFFENSKQDIMLPNARVRSKLKLEDYNLLHNLVSDRSSACHHWLFQRVACHVPALLCQSDSTACGPLMTAISKDKKSFIEAVLESDVDRTKLAEAIGLTDQTEGNCIHMAVKSKLSETVIGKLIEMASEETCCKQDREEMTPLHYAVEFERCTEKRLPVVLALIERSDKVFDVKSKKTGLRSVYLYHSDSRERFLAPKNKTKSKSRNPTRAKDSRPRSSKTPGNRLLDPPKKALPDKEKAKKQPITVVSIEEERRQLEVSRENGYPPNGSPALAHDAAKAKGSGESKHNSAHEMKGIGRSNTGLDPDKTGEAKNTPHVATSKGKDSAGSSKKSHSSKLEKDPREGIADIIAKEIKLRYLRSIFDQNAANLADSQEKVSQKERSHLRTYRTAVEFLYGDNKDDQQLYFEFPAMRRKEPEKIDFSDFECSYGNLKFDKALQYVRFRPLEVLNRQRRPAAGREDVYLFFQWLSKKSVKNIIKVIVDDRSNTPHSDYAIERSLRMFDIDILDWQKVDLDPRTIRESCRDTNLRELHLLWSGGNGILRAWSEPDGLVKIKTLQRIVLYEDQKHLEPKGQIDRNLDEFGKRLLKNRTDKYASITWRCERAEAQNRSRTEVEQPKEPGKVLQNYLWLEVMDNFVSGMDNLEFPDRVPEKYREDENLPLALRQDVTVALIDDGVDLMHKTISRNIENGSSFGDAFKDQDSSIAPQSFHASTTGHGTCMAQMITRLCPKVKIFVCKLDFIRQHDGKVSFTAKSAAEAVEHALLRKFDIISISWTIQRNDKNSVDLGRLDTALANAHKAGILVFCSAPDIGSERSQTLEDYYPYGCETLSPCLFRIGAANAEGDSYKNDKIKVDYILPGHNVFLREDDQLNEVDGLPKTGSSVATALAAGLAALVVHCVRISAIYSFYTKGPDDPNYIHVAAFQKMKGLKAMKAAFNTIDSRKAYDDRDDKNLRVRTFFQTYAEELNPDSQHTDERKWGQIIQLSNLLVHSLR